MRTQNKPVFMLASSRRIQRCQLRVGAMMQSCLWTPQTTTWSAPYARGSSGVPSELHATTSSARNASCSGSRGAEQHTHQNQSTRMLPNWIELDFYWWPIHTEESDSLLFVLHRQETCPCCRKPVNATLIFVMFKLSKSIGRMKIKVEELLKCWFFLCVCT